MTLADKLAAATTITDIERALVVAESRKMGFNEFMAEHKEEDPRIARFVERFPSAAAMAQTKNLLTLPALLDAVDRVVQ